MLLRPPLMLITGLLLLLVGAGCGGGDDAPDADSSKPRPCQTERTGAHPGPSADAARAAVLAYFLSCDPASCTEEATKHHIRADYGGDLSRCETVRRNNKLTSEDFTLAGDATVSGNTAEVDGQVLLTGETFVVELKLVDGSWKIDRIRDSQ